jgi:hypothetical protein
MSPVKSFDHQSLSVSFGVKKRNCCDLNTFG